MSGWLERQVIDCMQKIFWHVVSGQAAAVIVRLHASATVRNIVRCTAEHGLRLLNVELCIEHCCATITCE